jgi:hypothetical protein
MLDDAQTSTSRMLMAGPHSCTPRGKAWTAVRVLLGAGADREKKTRLMRDAL